MKNPKSKEDLNQLFKKGAIYLSLLMLTLFTLKSSHAQTGQCMNFDGVDDYIDLPFTIQNSYTKEAWVKISAIDGNQHNIISGNETAFFILDGYLSAGHFPTYLDVQSPTQLTVNVWHHVAVTYNHTTNDMVLYVDGVQVDAGVSSGFTDNKNYIGAFDIGTADYFFIYNLDEVRVWSSALPPAQIAAYSSCTLQNTETNLTAHYTFNQGIAAGNNLAITTLTDSSPNGYDGIIQNFGMTSAVSNFVSAGVTFSGPCSVLPVEITSFVAEKTGSDVKLAWKSAGESMNTIYYVERAASPNANWKQLGNIAANNASSNRSEYTFVDQSPEAGVNYYRIRQATSTGSIKYSAIRNVKFEEILRSFAVYPSLTQGNLTLDVSDQALLGTSYLVIDNIGRIVKKGLITQPRQQISVANIRNGMYFVKTVKGQTQKIIKQ